MKRGCCRSAEAGRNRLRRPGGVVVGDLGCGECGVVNRGLVNAPGALSWNELASSDVDASIAFYTELFGWATQPFEGSPQRYEIIQNKGRGNGGIREMAEGEPVPYWLVYYGIDSIDGGLSKAEELGGSKLMGPVDIGVAQIGMVQDPQGAVFALYDGQFEN